MRYLMTILIMAVATFSYGEEIPAPTNHDNRVRTVDFHPDEVYKVNSHYGYTLLIQLDPSEDIQAGAVAMGDPGAWKAAPLRNNLFLKPTAPDASTNMTVVTNKRTYTFDLQAVKGNRDAKMYMVRFNYPAQEHAKQLIAANKQQVSGLLDKRRNLSNWHYWANGSEGLEPVSVADNGQFTYLTFSNGQDMPAVYEETENGEALVNTHVEGRTIVVHKVSRKLVLRKGELVTCVLNRAYNNAGVPNSARSAVPGVKRVIKK